MIYNPDKTLFFCKRQKRGANSKRTWYANISKKELAYELFTDTKLPDDMGGEGGGGGESKGGFGR